MKRSICAAACIAVAVAACGPSIHVSTMAAPNAMFGQLHTFRVLTPPPRSRGLPIADDPMLLNSISNQVLQSSVTDAFLARGYTLDPASPDFTIAYYASARQRFEVTEWDYGYPGRWYGGWPGPRTVEVTPYTEGTVIIDVIDPKSKELLWRGRGLAMTSNDPAAFQRNLREAVAAIVRKFPAATRLAAE